MTFDKRNTLVHKETRKRVKVGDTLKTFRGESCTLAGFSRPHKPSSTGKVYVAFAGDGGYAGEYYPSVVRCEFVPARQAVE